MHTYQKRCLNRAKFEVCGYARLYSKVLSSNRQIQCPINRKLISSSFISMSWQQCVAAVRRSDSCLTAGSCASTCCNCLTEARLHVHTDLSTCMGGCRWSRSSLARTPLVRPLKRSPLVPCKHRGTLCGTLCFCTLCCTFAILRALERTMHRNSHEHHTHLGRQVVDRCRSCTLAALHSLCILGRCTLDSCFLGVLGCAMLDW